MNGSRFSEEEIIGVLREQEAGARTEEVCRRHGISSATFYAIFLMFYNFARIHQTLRVTPAMQAGVSDHVWAMEEIASLADEIPK